MMSIPCRFLRMGYCSLLPGHLESSYGMWRQEKVSLRLKNVPTLFCSRLLFYLCRFQPMARCWLPGSVDGTVRFWDVDESARRLVKVSGDVQQGTFGSELADPLVVEVRDRYNNPFTGC